MNKNNYVNRYSVPPPTYDPRTNTWKNEQTRNGRIQNRSQSGPQSRTAQNNSIPSFSPTSNSRQTATMSVPPPPLPPYHNNQPMQQMYSNGQDMYGNTRFTAGGVSYQGVLAYVSIPTNTFAPNSAYFSPPPPPPVPHNPPPPPPPPPSNHYQYGSPQKSYNNYSKRKAGYEEYSKKSNNKKKKKPLSQNVPRRDWTLEDAKRAMEVEKDFNKRNRCTSLIIKFPDTELNRDIVAKFHPSIDTVHFQQPSTPRFCFVSLKDNVNPEEVIKKLNRTRFGQGYLKVEYKKDKEDDMNIRPEDIDPLTLYVGNLAQNVMKEDMIKIYPKYKRVDIGFAKKMKFTRYAFVCFSNVDDSIEAFKKTHATQLYSKSLIVRFRRLHGTVGMPGEPKPQNPQKEDSRSQVEVEDFNHDPVSNDESHSESWDMVDVSRWNNSAIKQEQFDSENSENDDTSDSDDTSSDFARRMSHFLDEKSESANITDTTETNNRSISPFALNKKILNSNTSDTKTDDVNTVNDQEWGSSKLLPHQPFIEPKREFIDQILYDDDHDSDNTRMDDSSTWDGCETSVFKTAKAVSPQKSLLKKPFDEPKKETVDQVPQKLNVKVKEPDEVKSIQNTNWLDENNEPIHKPFVEHKREDISDEIQFEDSAINCDNPPPLIKIKSEEKDETTPIEISDSPVSLSNDTGVPIGTIKIKQEPDLCMNESLSGSFTDLTPSRVTIKNEPFDKDDDSEDDDDSDDDEIGGFGSLLKNLDAAQQKLKTLKS